MTKIALGSLALGVAVGVSACGGESSGTGRSSLQDAGTGGSTASAGGSTASAGGSASSTGGTTSAGGGTSSGGAANGGSSAVRECSSGADCKTAPDYCNVCSCVALGPNQTVPQCTGQPVQCFQNPCNGKAAECLNGKCVVGGSTACAAQGASCSSGQTCCGGLTCCSGVPVTPGNEYCSNNCPISDVNIKEGFTSVEPSKILEGVVSLPISRWSYITEGQRAEHLGPMAQDFKAKFGLGASDKTILQVDADGVALAAIQALNAKVQKLTEENAALRARVDDLAAARRIAR